MTYDDYKDEIELSIIQNGGVEIELYSIIADIIRNGKNSHSISLRDVSSRRTSNISKRYKGDGGFPDFVVFAREKLESAKILGCIEAKRPSTELDLKSEQIKLHIDSYHKVIYTNGLQWVFYNHSDSPVENIVIGRKLQGNSIKWCESTEWEELCDYIGNIEW